MADDDMEVVLTEEEKPEVQQNGADAKPSGAAPEPQPEIDTEGIEDLRQQLANERAARERAERERNNAMQRANQAETTAYGSQMAVIQGALDTISANRSALETQYEEAAAAGDFKRQREINSQLIKLEVQENELQKGKVALESRPREVVQQPSTPTETDRIALYTKDMTPRAKAWIEAHPEYVLDPRKNNRLLSQHHAALGAEIEQGSDDYFKFIEIGLGLAQGAARPAPNGEAAPDPMAAAARPVQRRDEVQPSPAPASRGGSPRRIVLSKSQQEAAAMSGMTNEQYAASLERERKAGTLIYTENAPRKH